jgi:predicted dienelactone hydrolase
MRPFEILLSIANLLTFCTFVIPRLRAMRWSGYLAFVTMLIAGIQMLVEGSRWQMVPAYASTAIFLSIWVLGIMIPGGLHVNRAVSFLGAGVGVLVLLISFALPILMPVFHFPNPSGPYAIGTLTYHWIDTSRPELFTTDPNDYRQLVAQVWYPAMQEPSAPRAPYIQDAEVVTPAIGRLLHLPGFVFSHLKYVTTHAVAAAPIAVNQPSYPVLIYLSGVDGFRSASTFQIGELVSHGFIVVGLDQPGIAPAVRFPDGQQILGWPRDQIQPLIMQSVEPQSKAPTIFGKPQPDGIIPYFAQDASFALDQLTELNKSDPHHILTGRLDLERVGAFGISLGGMDAAEACLKDPRLKACLIMDVWLPANVVKLGLQQPAMFITRDAGTMRLEHQRFSGWSEKDIALTLNTMRAVYESLPGDGYYVQIPGMFHVNFTDLPYWSPLMSQIGVTGPINAQRGFDIVNAYSVAFFDEELKGQPSSLLNGSSQPYPEVTFSARQP